MPPLTAPELKWITDLAGDGKTTSGAVTDQQRNDDAIFARKQQLLEQMAAALDLVRDEIAEGERYELTIKGRFSDKTIKSIEQAGKTFEEVETREDIQKAEALSIAQQKKIFEAHQEAVKVKDILVNAKVPGPGNKDTDEPLFTDEEITEEFWTPVMRERLLPDNAIPPGFSAVQKPSQPSAQLYADRLDEIEAESGSHEDLAKKLGITSAVI